MKTLNYQAVEEIATKLINENGTTTSLEVKNKAREEDYWATQREVSNLLKEVSDDNGWDCEQGRFNTYSIATMDEEDVEEEDEAEDAQVVTQANPDGLTPDAGDNAAEANYDTLVATWVASTGGNNPKEYQNVTRSKARTLYAKEFDVHYNAINCGKKRN